MSIEIADIQAYYNLKSQGHAVVTTAADGSTYIDFKRYSSDTGEEMPDNMAHAPFSLDELNALKQDLAAKTALVDNLIAEIGKG